MKTFFGRFFASCLGTMIGIVLLVGIGIWVASKMGSDAPTTKPNTVLKLTLNKPLPELSNNVSQQGGDFESLFEQQVGLSDLCALIDIAKDDDNIKGIYLELGSVSGGLATLKTVRKKLDEFKESGKFIVAYGNAFSQRAYYMASVVNEVYLHPHGAMDFLGFSAQIMYYKGFMDKIGVKFQIYYAGKFKSATEPFRRTDMSEANRRQVRAYVGGSYRLFLKDIAASRNMTVSELYNIADEAAIRDPEDAVKQKMIDGTAYKDEVLDNLREKLGLGADEKVKAVGLSKYHEINKAKINPYKDAGKIAVVYAEGGIVNGSGDRGSIGGDKYAREIRKIRRDDDVKAIVLRINSGGGSALASDIIWREIEKAKEQGITVVASMGDVAASGGYYIAANADKIYAEENTITGSIGVFGMIPNARELVESKLGVTVDTVKTTKFSNLTSGVGYYELTEEQGEIIQESIEDIYTLFKKRVSDGRGLSMAEVDSVARGRVWLGVKAKEIGLVDELGGLENAMAEAAELANLSDYRVVNYPKVKTFEEMLLEGLNGDKSDGASSKLRSMLSDMPKDGLIKELGAFYPLYKQFKSIEEFKGVQMRMPYEIVIE